MNKIISIAPFSAAFLELFVNIGNCLQANGIELEFLNPDRFIAHELKKRSFTVKQYPSVSKNEEYYDKGDELIVYHSRLYRIRNQKKFINSKNTEYSKCKAFFESESAIRIVLFWNGSGTVEKDVVEQLGVEAYYFENGYFPNTLQVNKGGVNCNSDYAKLTEDAFLKYNFATNTLDQKNYSVEKVVPNPLKRMTRRLFDSSFNFMIQEALSHNVRLSKAKKRFASLPVDQFDLTTIGDYIFFPLQVNSDTQIILNSEFDSMYHAVETVLPDLLKTGKKVVFKEHPFEVELVDYSRFIDNKNTFLLRKFDINTLIDKASFTVNVNSSVGLQAIERGGKVLLLGKSMYDHAPNCQKYEGFESIDNLIADPLTSEELIKAYIEHFKSNIFLQGNWKQIDHQLIQQIAERILA